MTAPDKIYVEVCEDGIFAFPEPPFKESVEYIRADIVGQSLHQEQPEVDLEKEIDSEWKKCLPIDEGMGVEVANIHIEAFDIIARHFYELGLNARKEESHE